ncbi:P-loop containing nucleoside triphosphate hydrolase protein [Phanerochaete sordida]|uniref:P-loop containing nucleoside triphosphate hydrolase protein n=1 Tax=Phanerochaete sordida TaxID=48140 RepID=A0A9P3GPA5_9APHY|nr:P-loop containing nucleoside triphosphate hydrolase protein [Phanerochaete sordida]
MTATTHTKASSDISQSSYAKRTRDLIGLMTDLRALGAEADFDLPRIAVIGNQSAGKSSLVEAISGITVPRASGTCTRCPMECRLTHSNRPWECQVLLRRETDASGNTIKVQEEPFGPMLYDKDELEEMLRRAQLAILNPSLPAEFFVDFDTASLGPGVIPPGSDRQLSFSDNVVCLNLSSPDVTDLSFIDLPGIISNVANGEDRGNIDAVRNMVSKHIQGNTLILLTITMRDDIDNQGAAHLARLADEEGLRTIGVLTKPDTIQRGEEDAWLRILEGASHPLKHGYFVTKQPSPMELEEKVSFSEARRREKVFFEETAPWCHKSGLSDRMGTPHLTKALSKLLGGVINSALPALRAELKESLQDVARRTAALPPPPPENPAAELLRLVTGFAGDVRALIQGVPSCERLMQQCRPAYKRFKRDIHGTKPDFVPFTAGEDASGFRSPALEPEMEGEGRDDDSGVGLDDAPAQKMDLDAVKAHIESSLTRELPHNVPFAAKVALIARFLADWDEHCRRCSGAVHAAALRELQGLVRAHFGQYRGTALMDHVEGMLEEQVERCRAATAQRLAWLLALESPPFTNNDHYFSAYREKYLTRYKDARKSLQPVQIPESANVHELMSALAGFGFTGLKEEDLGRLRGVDPHEEQLIVMAETAAYFHVAYKRIIDNVPRVVDHDFLGEIARGLQGALVAGLGLGDAGAAERARAYLAEDDGVTAQRALLEQKRARLEGVQSRLYNFGM